MGDILGLIKARRSVRDFQEDRRIPRETLLKILEAGIWAPSGGNIQPWEFVVVEDREVLRRVKMLSPGMSGNPSLVVVLCINKERARRGGRLGELSALMDISMAAQNMMLEAYSLGIASCPVLSFSREGVKELLELPEHIDPALMIAFGYARRVPSPPRRRPLEEVVHVNRYGERIRTTLH